MSILLENISERFGTHWALKNINLTINPGETVAVLGANGSGKSTLLKILATLLKPTRGKGMIFGDSLTEELALVRRKTHWLGHEFNLYKTLTAEENLKFFYSLKGEKANPEKIDFVLQLVGLQKEKRKAADHFSAGMQKRLAIARALLKDFTVYLLDEPHTNLDKEGKNLMDRCIANWKKKGATLFLASHDHSNVLPLADRMLILEHGEICYFGEPKKL